MTRFLPTDIPLSVQSVEQLLAWAGCVLDYLNKDTMNVESLKSDGTELPSRSITANVFYNDAPSPTDYRLIVRASLKTSPDYKFKPVWNCVTDLSSADIPDSFKK